MDKKFEERFWSKVSISGNDECWNWKAYTNNEGYGNFSIDGKKRWNAHRVAYILTFGDIPAGMVICHKCDNPSCVNPNHLFIGTPKDNMRDKVQKGRSVYKRLSEEQKEQIKKSNKTAKQLAKEYSVSASAIRHYR